MSDEEFENNNEVVPFKKYTSLDPQLQWRIDNLKCECGNCHHLSGTKNKDCWVFTELGCDFSIAVHKYFHLQNIKDKKLDPIFNPDSKKQ